MWTVKKIIQRDKTRLKQQLNQIVHSLGSWKRL